ncbi:MAG: diguanylate cyclase [Alphaproteobacteria bacterium]|nr:diguanylate cyclase [Alphaproteobacteria bacterium]
MVDQTPVLPVTFWRRAAAPAAAPKEPAREAIYAVDADENVSAFPGPAILFGSDGALLSANGGAERLVRAIAVGEAADVRTLLASVAATDRPAMGQIFLPADPAAGEEQALFYLTALAIEQKGLPKDFPQSGARRVMLLGRDGSAEYAMRNALIASRELYRDLSRCSSDFRWQTDENGAFTFVSPKGALSYSAQALNGRRSHDLFDKGVKSPQENPFVSRASVEAVEIILRDANGEVRHCRVDALPVYDKLNQWRGARGVSTDITDARRQQQALEFLQKREMQAREIVEAANKSLDPVQAFNEAAILLAHATGAARCKILSLDNKKRLRILGVSETAGHQDYQPVLTRIELELHEMQYGQDCDPIIFQEDGQTHQITITMHAGAPNAVIWLQNPETENTPPPEDAPSQAGQRSLAQTVAGNIGVAIAHDNQMRRLAELSRTDELTGLMNRRAFMEDLHHRHGHLYRISRTGALLYIDLDNFKPVNDQYGHEAGDRVLKAFANILMGQSRIGDLCARLGGDEFAIWLEDTDAGGAEVKARHLINESRDLCRLAGIAPRPDAPILGLSVGVAVADPGFPEQLQQLIKRADEVMYQVKRSGKGSMIVSQGPLEAGAAGHGRE